MGYLGSSADKNSLRLDPKKSTTSHQSASPPRQRRARRSSWTASVVRILGIDGILGIERRQKFPPARSQEIHNIPPIRFTAASAACSPVELDGFCSAESWDRWDTWDRAQTKIPSGSIPRNPQHPTNPLHRRVSGVLAGRVGRLL